MSNSSINKANKYLTTPGRMTLPPFNNLEDISGMLLFLIQFYINLGIFYQKNTFSTFTKNDNM